MKTALIIGINGQDGSYLAEYLLRAGYHVVGTIRRHSVAEEQDSRIADLKVETAYADVTDRTSIAAAMEKFEPHEVYNLAAMSHVRISFEVPQFTCQTNAMGVLNVLEAIRHYNRKIKFYQASSSEMFGNSVDQDGFQRETTPMHPTSPYGCAKLFGYSITRHYRRAYGMFCCNGILFNHTSPRRGSNFVIAKICKHAAEVLHGGRKHICLGNLEARRDFGHSADYVRAMHLMMQQDSPDDFVIATGESRSVWEVCELVCGKLGLDAKEIVRSISDYRRPEELHELKGDATKARNTFGWMPHYSFDRLVEEILDQWR